MPRVNNIGFPIRNNGEPVTMDLIKDRIIEEGDCWIWMGAYSHTAPAVRDGDKVVQVRRLIAEKFLGKKINGLFAVPKCKNSECVCPDHIRIVSRATLNKMTIEKTQFHLRPDRIAKLKLAAQKRYNIDMNKVEAVRKAEGSGRQIAKDFGMNLSVVQKIRNGAHYQIGNVWAGLMR